MAIKLNAVFFGVGSIFYVQESHLYVP